MNRDTHPPTRDPLQLARTQLDFAALATSAPAVKEVLFKAQTMAPYAPPQFWKKAGRGAAAATVLAILLFAPYLPSQVRYTILRVEFERPLAPARAQEAIDAVIMNLPPEITVGIEQRQTQASKQAIAPRVVLRLGAVGVSGSWLRHQAEDALLAVATEAQPLYYPVEEFCRRKQNSLVQVLASSIAPDTQPHYGLPGKYGAQAERLLRLEPILRAETGARLATGGYEVTGLKFVEQLDALPAGFNFVVPAWPLPVAVAVTGYAAELDSEQLAIRQVVVECLAEFNLLPEPPFNLAVETQWPPLAVIVQDDTGRMNPQLAARIQAELQQPTLSELDHPAFDPAAVVAQAASQVLPAAKCEFFETRTQRADGSLGWRVAVVVAGERTHTLRLFQGRATAESDETF